jgi:hypothetical protein
MILCLELLHSECLFQPYRTAQFSAACGYCAVKYFERFDTIVYIDEV